MLRFLQNMPEISFFFVILHRAMRQQRRETFESAVKLRSTNNHGHLVSVKICSVEGNSAGIIVTE